MTVDAPPPVASRRPRASWPWSSGPAGPLGEAANVALITLDTLRYDVAQNAWREGRTPNLAALLGPDGWQQRHTPGSFTYSAHAAFFAGFWPTPISPGPHRRRVALAFAGSETIGPDTLVLDAADVPAGFRDRGFHTVCIGGVGFFDLRTPLSRTLPGLFDEAHWDESMGVTSATSFEAQITRVAEVLERLGPQQRVFLFLNVAAFHQPNCIFSPDGADEDSPATQADALAYLDRHLPALLTTLADHGAWEVVACSDHGTTYGEAGHTGHRLAHEVVWTVPYTELAVEATP